MTIQDTQPVTAQALSDLFARDVGQISRLLASFERKNLISKTQSETDRRVSLLQLTPRGEALVGDFQAALAGVIDDLLGGLSGIERDQFAAILKKALS